MSGTPGGVPDGPQDTEGTPGEAAAADALTESGTADDGNAAEAAAAAAELGDPGEPEGAAAAAEAAAAPPTPVADPRLENTLMLELKDGSVTIELRPDLAPRHVERIKLLVRQGFYDNTPFHRVIEGFMAQGGDPSGTGRGGAREQGLDDLPAEFTPAQQQKFLRGTCGMARTADPDSASSQFFIMFAAAPSLDGQYTIWGKVTAGMEAVDKIKRGVGGNGVVKGPDRILRARIAADPAPASRAG
jgi:cyclophilin family peptidyl-prolyl cis-trans isomerase